VLTAGILAGPGGGDILAGGDLPGFFAKIHQWYGDQQATIYPGSDPHNLSPEGQPLPDAATFDLQATARTHFQTFPVYVRYANKAGIYFPDQPEFQDATPLQLQQLLAGQAQ